MQYQPLYHLTSTGIIAAWTAQVGNRTVVVGEDRFSPEGNPSSSWETRFPSDPDEDPGMTAFVFRDTLEECPDYDPAVYNDNDELVLYQDGDANDEPPPKGTAPLPWFYLVGEAIGLSDYQDLLRYWGEGSDTPLAPPRGISPGVTSATFVTRRGISPRRVLLYAWEPTEGNIPLRGLVVLPGDEKAVAYATKQMERKAP